MSVISGYILAGIAVLELVIVSIALLHFRRTRKQKRLDSLHKTDIITSPDGVDSNSGTLVAPTGDELQGRPHLSPTSSEGADLGHKMDNDEPAHSNVLLRPSPMLHATAPVPRSPHVGRSGALEPESSLSFVSPTLFLPSAPPLEDIPLDEVSFRGTRDPTSRRGWSKTLFFQFG